MTIEAKLKRNNIIEKYECKFSQLKDEAEEKRVLVNRHKEELKLLQEFILNGDSSPDPEVLQKLSKFEKETGFHESRLAEIDREREFVVSFLHFLRGKVG